MTLLEHELDNLATSRLRELAADTATSPTVRTAVKELLDEREQHARRGHDFLTTNFPTAPPPL